MVCSKFTSFKGCGKCEVSLTNYQQIKRLSSVTIADIVDKLFEFCNEDKNKKLQLTDTTINCRGYMAIAYDDDIVKDYTVHNRRQCKTFIGSWTQFHKSIFIDAISAIYLYRCKSILGSLQPNSEMISQASALHENMTQLVNDLEAF